MKRYEVFVVTRYSCYRAGEYRWHWLARFKAWEWRCVGGVVKAFAQVKPDGEGGE